MPRVYSNNIGLAAAPVVTGALALAASTMTPGQAKRFRSDSAGGPSMSAFTTKDMIQQLTSTIYYDDVRKEIQFMGKPAQSQSTSYGHYLYRESTNTLICTRQDNLGHSGIGHLWNHAFDPLTGDFFLNPNVSDVIIHFRRGLYSGSGSSVSAWRFSSTCPSTWVSSGGVIPGGMGWHPNLGGPGVGGCVIRASFNTVAWFPHNDTWQRIKTISSGTPHRTHPAGGRGNFLAHLNRLVVGTGDDGGQSAGRVPLERILPGTGTSAAPVVATTSETSVTDPPVNIRGHSGYATHAHCCIDPTDPTVLLLIDSGANGNGGQQSTRRWWRSFDGGDTWVQQDALLGVHPFWGGPATGVSAGYQEPYFTLGSIPAYGIVVGIHSGIDVGLANSDFWIWKPPPTTPQWFANATANTWVSVAPNGIEPVKPAGTSVNGVTDAWTGGCVDPERKALVLPADGGHLDYSGNEIYQLRLGVTTPAWERLDNPSSTSGGVNGSFTLLSYGDNTPRSAHSRNNPQFVQGKIWYPWLDGCYPNGFFGPSVWSHDRAALGESGFPSALKPWTSHGVLFTASGNQNFEGSCSCYDPVADKFWIICSSGALTGGYSVFSFGRTNPAGTYQPHAIGSLGASFGSSSWAVVASASTPRVIIYGDRASGNVRLLDISTGAPTQIRNAIVTGSPTGIIKDAGAVYIASKNAVYCYHHSFGANIRKLAIPADPINGTYVWSTITIGGLDPSSTKNTNSQGCHSKFNYIPDMGGGVGAFVVFMSHNKPTYVCKVGAI